MGFAAQARLYDKLVRGFAKGFEIKGITETQSFFRAGLSYARQPEKAPFVVQRFCAFCLNLQG